MDKMSLFSILTVSIPDVIFNIYVGFVLTGNRTRLYLDDRLNVLRLLILIPVMVISIFFIRLIFHNVMVILLLNVIVYMIAIKFIYKLKFLESLLVVFLFTTVVVLIESLLMPVTMYFVDDINKIYENDLLRFYVTLPERFIQLGIIFTFWNWDLVYFKILRDKRIRLHSILTFAFLLSSEIVLSYLYISNFNVLNETSLVLFAVVSVFLVCFNYFISRLLLDLASNK